MQNLELLSPGPELSPLPSLAGVVSRSESLHLISVQAKGIQDSPQLAFRARGLVMDTHANART